MKILVVGASGMLGHQMWARLNKHFPGQVWGTVRKNKESYSKFKVFNLDQIISGVDILSFEKVESVLNELRPKWIINCVGITLRKPDISDLEKSVEINGMLPHRLRIWAENHQAKVIHFSTDCVFDGKRGDYSESDLPTASDLYGKSKFLGEISGLSALTLRLSIIGRELEAKTELVEWFLAQKGKTAKGFSKAIYTGLTTIRVAEEVARIIQKQPALNGVFQVSSEKTSKYELLNLLNRHFNLGINLEKYDAYAADKSLKCDKYITAAGFVKPKWEEMIKELAQDQLITYEV